MAHCRIGYWASIISISIKTESIRDTVIPPQAISAHKKAAASGSLYPVKLLVHSGEHFVPIGRKQFVFRLSNSLFPITEHFVSPYGTVCFHTENSLLQGTKQLVSSKPTKYGSRDSHHSISGKTVRTRTFLKKRPERTIRKALFFLKILPISLNQS